MQNVSIYYATNSQKRIRNVCQKVTIDWFGDNTFIDESQYIEVIEIDRELDEPMGGVFSTLADITLVNNKDRFTPAV